MLSLLETAGRLAHFAFQALLALPAALARPRETAAQLYDLLLGSLPLAFTAGAAIGVVVWLHLRGALVAVGGPGAVQYLPQALALAVVLEFAPIAAGLIGIGEPAIVPNQVVMRRDLRDVQGVRRLAAHLT